MIVDLKVAYVSKIRFILIKDDNSSQLMSENRKRAIMSMEVNQAVNDILHGTSVDSHTQWLQREYIRLMRRECNNNAPRNRDRDESNLGRQNNPNNPNNPNNQNTQQ